MTITKGFWVGFLALSAFLLSWEWLGHNFEIVSIMCSSPSKIIFYMIENIRDLSLDFGHTLLVSIAGYSLSLVVGVGLAYIGLSFRKIGDTLLLIGSVGQTLPVIVFVPFFIILFGTGFTSKILLATSMALLAVMLTLITVLRAVRDEYRDLIEFFDIPPALRFGQVIFPVGISSALGAFRVGAGLSFLGAIVAEFTGSEYGLGKNIFLASIRLEPELLMSSVILCLCFGIFAHIVFMILERHLSVKLNDSH